MNNEQQQENVNHALCMHEPGTVEAQKHDWIRSLFRNKIITPSEKTFASVIVDFMEEGESTAAPTTEDIKRAGGWKHHGTFTGIRRSLIDAGALTVEWHYGSTHRSYRYHLNLDWDGVARND